MNAEQALMGALLQSGTDGAAREQLLSAAQVGHASFYRLIRPLLEKGLVVVDGGRYRMSLSVPYNYRFKLWRDMERLYELEPVDRAAVLDVLASARSALGDNLLALLLVGSAANGTLRPESHLDFLAICRKSTPYAPRGSRSIQFAVRTDRQFRASCSSGDDFALTALGFGIVLHDREYLQEFYVGTPGGAQAPSDPIGVDDTLDRLADKLHLQVKNKDELGAAATLKGYALTLSRMLLKVFNQRPAGKPDMLRLLVLLCGSTFREIVADAVEDEVEAPSTRHTLHRHEILSRYRDRYRQTLSHLAAFAALPGSTGLQLKSLTTSILGELFDEVESGAGEGVDLIVRAGHVRWFVLCKGSRGELSQAAQEQLRRLRRDHKKRELLLVANLHATVPLLRRPQLGDRISGVRTVSALDLLRCHNVFHLEDMPVDESRSQLLERSLDSTVG